MNDLPYRQKVEELLTLLEADHVPPRVKLTVPRLSECHNKLFCMVGESDLALGTAKLAPGIYPSNFLCELVEAVRALDWPKVISFIHAVAPGCVSEGKDIPPDIPKTRIEVPG